VRALSVGVIKAILQQNHVRLGAGVLEKSELVARVLAVVDDERQERARDEAWRAAEEEEERLRAEAARQEQARASQPSAEENHDVDMDAGHQVDPDVSMTNATPPPTIVEDVKAEVKPLPPKAQAMAAHLERTGLCVICQVRHLIFPVASHELNVLGRTRRRTWPSSIAGTLRCVVAARTSSWAALASARYAGPGLLRTPDSSASSRPRRVCSSWSHWH
jgi:hypothetical protein